MTMYLRKCVSCGRQDDKYNFIRVSKTKCVSGIKISVFNLGDSTYIDGRSAYLCPTTKCFNVAKKKGRIEKSLKCRICTESYDKILEFINLENAKNEENAYTC